MTIGDEIAAARTALEPVQAALILYNGLFERGPNRLSSSDRFIALGTITAGLIEWKKQLLSAKAGEIEKWKKRYEDAKAELDDVKLKLAILQKEQ